MMQALTTTRKIHNGNEDGIRDIECVSMWIIFESQNPRIPSRNVTSLTMSNFIVYRNSLKKIAMLAPFIGHYEMVDISHAYFIIIDKSWFVWKLVGTIDSTFIEIIPKAQQTCYRNKEHI